MLQETKKRMRVPGDPWRKRLERLQGHVWSDGIERISTAAVLDFLELPQASRGPGTCRRVAKLMRELEWTPIKARGLNQAGFREQIRGYARDRKNKNIG